MRRKNFYTFVSFDEFESKALAKMSGDIARSQGKKMSKAEIVRGCLRYYIKTVLGVEYVTGTPKEILDRTKFKPAD